MYYLTLTLIPIIKVYGQQQYDINSDELNAVLRAIIHPDNAQYEMHRQSLQNALENMLASDYLEDEEKRSIATLAKNGQLPSREPDTEMGKSKMLFTMLLKQSYPMYFV